MPALARGVSSSSCVIAHLLTPTPHRKTVVVAAAELLLLVPPPHAASTTEATANRLAAMTADGRRAARVTSRPEIGAGKFEKPTGDRVMDSPAPELTLASPAFDASGTEPSARAEGPRRRRADRPRRGRAG